MEEKNELTKEKRIEKAKKLMGELDKLELSEEELKQVSAGDLVMTGGTAGPNSSHFPFTQNDDT